MRGRDAYLASRCLARSQVGAGGRLKTNQSWGRREGRWRWVQVPGAEQTGRFDGRQASIELQTAGSSCCWRGRRPEMGGAVGSPALRAKLMRRRRESPP